MTLMLDKQGLILTIILGAFIFYFADWRYLFVIIAFFVLSTAATRYEHDRKRELGIYEHERSWENVLSNGLVPTILAVLSPNVGYIPYLASVAAITADKFSSELGVLAGNPISLETLKPVREGKSGAISFLGLLTSLVGGIIIGLTGIALFGITPTSALLIGFCGFIGSFIDSIIGIFEEKGIGNKGTTNFFCSFSGALLGYFLNSYGIMTVS